jgi:predicted transcriptional regulator
MAGYLTARQHQIVDLLWAAGEAGVRTATVGRLIGASSSSASSALLGLLELGEVVQRPYGQSLYGAGGALWLCPYWDLVAQETARQISLGSADDERAQRRHG